jgi:hypothetical protein
VYHEQTVLVLAIHLQGVAGTVISELQKPRT